MGEQFKNEKDVKQELVQLFVSKDETFSKMGYTNCPHAGKRTLITMAIILFNTVNWQ